MIGDEKVVVIDYKSGDTESEKYKFQVRSYLNELRKCGFKNVSGYIWYTKTNKKGSGLKDSGIVLPGITIDISLQIS